MDSRLGVLVSQFAFCRRHLLATFASALLAHGLSAQQAPAPQSAEYTLPVPRSAPNFIVSGPDGNLWFSQEFNDQIGAITTTGAITDYSVPNPSENYVNSMVAGPGGQVWFAEFIYRRIGSVTPTGVFTEHPLPQGQDAYGLAVGPDGNIWYTDDMGDHIGKMDSAGVVTTFSITTAPVYIGPHGITSGPDGNLWFTENAAGKIGRITLSGVVTEFPLPTSGSLPQFITSGPDGNLWFTELSGAIGKITPNGVVTEYPASLSEWGVIAAGPDGALWFSGAAKIGRITVDGVISEYAIPTSSEPYGITTGPDGNIWFTEQTANKIGKIILSSSLPAGPVTVSQSSLTFTSPYLSVNKPPPSQTFTVSAPAPTAFTATVDPDIYSISGMPWLTIAPSGALSANQTITVSVNTGILLPGDYSGVISILSAGTVQQVKVSFTVTPTSGGNIYTNAGLVQLPCTIGSIDRCAAELNIMSQTSSVQKNSFVISTAVTTPSGGNWLSLVSPDGTIIPSGSSGVTPYSVEVGANLNGLSAGSYSGMITIAPAGGTVENIPVSLTLRSPATPSPVVLSVTNAASNQQANLSPGEVITIYGTGLGPTQPAGLLVNGSGKVSTGLNGTLVLINGSPAPLLYVSDRQVNCVVPYEAAPGASITIQATFLGIASNSYQAAGANAAPAIFTLNGSGKGLGAVLNATGGVNGPNNPAPPGSTVTIFLTGEGQTNPAGVTGAVTAVNAASSGRLTPQPLSAPSVTIDGIPAAVSFYGEAPGLVSGILQINAVIPVNAHTGDIPVLVNIGGVNTQSGVTISVQ